jgi:hypothetical protein
MEFEKHSFCIHSPRVDVPSSLSYKGAMAATGKLLNQQITDDLSLLPIILQVLPAACSEDGQAKAAHQVRENSAN